ncbi:MAG TPA: L-serine ammonia-lyase, iron-sulfur-dependent, subunit alpha, partial [Erysipelothrix sp.]
MFNTIESLVKAAKAQGSLSEVIIQEEVNDSGFSRERIWEIMASQREVMMQSIENGKAGVFSQTGLTGGDAQKLHAYIEKGDMISDPTILTAVQNAMGTNEVNASMGLICATPTAGSAGVV